MSETQGSGRPSQRLEKNLPPGPAEWQQRWHTVIFEAETPEGKAFDVVLMAVILLSILAVMLESVPWVQKEWGTALAVVEWIITLLFTFEYGARMACVAQPSRYARSFFGIVDIVSILPSYLALFFTGAHTLATIRTLRLLRVFRVLKLGRHLSEARSLLAALKHTWPKITVFLTTIFCSIIILGTVMYLIERNEESGFDNIPVSVYWAVVTMTTVGYGDIAPVTPLGKGLAALVMLFGYAVIIVPTGIFSAEVIIGGRGEGVVCGACGRKGQPEDAAFCAGCGAEI